jgi:hypothetical protein
VVVVVDDDDEPVAVRIRPVARREKDKTAAAAGPDNQVEHQDKAEGLGS